MPDADTARVQHEFSPAKSFFMLALVIGCFAILWPKVFHPMIQATFMKKGSSVAEKYGDSVCCDVIYENKIDFKFFAELCKSVIEREMATDAGIRKHRMEKYPPPGMLERCRKKIQEVCDIDISEALMKTKRGSWISMSSPTPAKPSKYRKDDVVQEDQSASKPKLNLTECLEKHFHLDTYRRSASRRWTTATAAPSLSHIRQERPLHVGPAKLHPALRERGNPFSHFQNRGRPVSVTANGKDRDSPNRHSTTAVRPGMGVAHSKPPGPSKGVGAMSLLMPIYTVGIAVFFLYTMSKMLMRAPDWRADTTRIIEYHSDPEYRSYLTRHKYDKSSKPLTYKEFLRQKEEDERKKSAIALLGGKGRKQVFTAIEGIIAEMDEYRERVKAEQCLKTNTDEDEIANGQINHTCSPVVHHANDNTKDKLEDELARISALEVKEEVEPISEKAEMDGNAEQVPNIVLERSMPPDAKIMVAESECLTHTTTEHIDGWSDIEDQPVVVTGKMTISLVGNAEASVRSTETKKEAPVRSTPSPTPESRDRHSQKLERSRTSSPERRSSIEKLANALVDDMFRNQVPRLMDKSSLRSVTSGPKKQISRESMSSQSSSFDYVSCSQDEPNQQTPILEEEAVGADGEETDAANGSVLVGSLLCTSTNVTVGCDMVNTETIVNAHNLDDSGVDREDVNEDINDDGDEVNSRDQTPEVDEIGRLN